MCTVNTSPEPLNLGQFKQASELVYMQLFEVVAHFPVQMRYHSLAKNTELPLMGEMPKISQDI
jgi:hypothetical protein